MLVSNNHPLLGQLVLPSLSTANQPYMWCGSRVPLTKMHSHTWSRSSVSRRGTEVLHSCFKMYNQNTWNFLACISSQVAKGFHNFCKSCPLRWEMPVDESQLENSFVHCPVCTLAIRLSSSCSLLGLAENSSISQPCKNIQWQHCRLCNTISEFHQHHPREADAFFVLYTRS